MGYATLAMVKERLQMDVSESKHEEEILRAMSYADGWIDSQFAQYDKTVPIVPPQQIKDASADLAAFYYLRNRTPSKATTFYETGTQLITDYLHGQYRKGTAIRRGHERFET